MPIAKQPPPTTFVDKHAAYDKKKLFLVSVLALITAGYALFQAANNTAVLASSRPDERGVISGLLNLSRNLGLVTGASVMGTVFAFGTGANTLVAASAAEVAAGMRLTFAVAAALVLVALGIALAGQSLSRRAAPATGP